MVAVGLPPVTTRIPEAQLSKISLAASSPVALSSKITPLAREGSSYWTNDGMALVRFDGMQEVKPIEFDILRKVRVYVNGDFLPFKQ